MCNLNQEAGLQPYLVRQSGSLVIVSSYMTLKLETLLILLRMGSCSHFHSVFFKGILGLQCEGHFSSSFSKTSENSEKGTLPETVIAGMAGMGNHRPQFPF